MGSLKGAMAGLGIAAVGATLISMTRAAIDNADALNEMAERTGIAGDKLSELQYAAELNGSSLAEVEVALKKVSTKAFDAATGNKAAAATFDALGISVQGIDGALKTSDVLMQEIADVLNTVQDRTTRTALAVELFGKSGASLIPLLENMRDSREEAQRLGVVVGVDFQKASDEYNDNLTRMSFLSKAFATDLANVVLPTVNRFFDELIAGREIFGGYWAALKNVGTTNPFNSAGENAKKYQDQVQGLQGEIQKLATGQNKWFGPDTAAGKARLADLNGELENTKKLVEYFSRMSGAGAGAGGGRGSINPANVNAGNGNDILERIKSANTKAAGGASKESEFDRLKKQYEDMTIRVGELSEAEKLLKEIQLGRYKDLKPDQQAELVEMAKTIDYKKLVADSEKALEAQRLKATNARTSASATEQAELEKTKAKWEEVADPARKFREEIEKIKEALAGGIITQEVADKNVEHLNGMIDKLADVKDKGKDAMEELKDAVNGWGKEATDAFVDFAFTGKASFGDMVGSILKDMARMLIQTQVMGPLFKALGNSLPGLLPFKFADGGIMSGAGSLPLNAYASGGVATGPQLALFGEGRMNEAYVPLPDGRSIPVTMQGGGGGDVFVSVTVNAETGETKNTDPGMFGQLGGIIAGAVRQEIIQQKRPGGLLAA